MSRNISASADLASKFAVGEIVDMVGVPDYYDAGSSKWMRSGTWVPASSVPSNLVSTLKSYSGNLVALSSNALINETGPRLFAGYPKCTIGTTTLIPYRSDSRDNARASNVLVINSSGLRIANTGLSLLSSGCSLTADGTKFMMFAAASSTTLQAVQSTDGITWNTATLTGLPTFNGLTTTTFGAGLGSANSLLFGDIFYSNETTYKSDVYFCGNRYIAIGLNASNQYLTSTSTDGLTWSGDTTTAVLGSTAIGGGGGALYFYRNGNNVFIAVSSLARKSSDGGITWSAAIDAPFASGPYSAFRVNASDGNRIIGTASTNNSDISVSTDSGQTWTARNLPASLSAQSGVIQGRGSSWVFTKNGTVYVSTNDATSWSLLTTLPAELGRVTGVYADANRWYALSMVGNQVAVSTDLINWTLRNISNPQPANISSGITYNFAATDTNNIMAVVNGNALYSTNGGVTWSWSTASRGDTATAGNVLGVTAITEGGGVFISSLAVTTYGSGQSLYNRVADLAAGGEAVRSSAAVVSSLRTNALAYSRVA